MRCITPRPAAAPSLPSSELRAASSAAKIGASSSDCSAPYPGSATAAGASGAAPARTARRPGSTALWRTLINLSSEPSRAFVKPLCKNDALPDAHPCSGPLATVWDSASAAASRIRFRKSWFVKMDCAGSSIPNAYRRHHARQRALNALFT